MKFWLLLFTYSLLLLVFYIMVMEIYVFLFFKIADLMNTFLRFILAKSLFICLVPFLIFGLAFSDIFFSYTDQVIKEKKTIIGLCWVVCMWISALNCYRRHGARLKSSGYFKIFK